MTREETIKILNDEEIASLVGKFHGGKEALDLAISALRPAGREQVEKVWKGEWKLIGAGKTGRGGIWYCTRCEKCYPYTCDFCPRCGAPMTDEAVEMVMERLKVISE